MSDCMLERLLLYPLESELSIDEIDHDILQKVSQGSYADALQSEECFDVIFNQWKQRNDSITMTEFLTKNINSYLNDVGIRGEITVLAIGIASLQLFTQNNFCGPFIGPDPKLLFSGLIPPDQSDAQMREDAFEELILDMEGMYNLLQFPEYLIIARVILFEMKSHLSNCPSVDWWCFRYGLIHQKIADEESPTIYDGLVQSLEFVERDKDALIGEHRDILALFHLEACHLYQHYNNVGKSRVHLDKAISVLGLEFGLSGALGKRTKWQGKDIAQLVVTVSYNGKSISQNGLPTPLLLPSDLPKDVLLDDDTRLHRIKYANEDDDVIPNLRPIEQAALFTSLILKQKASCQDAQLIEETKAYLASILQYPKNWSLQMSALFTRCKGEVGESRTMQRSLSQLEELSSALNREEPSRFQRLKLIHSSLLITHWDLQQENARMLMRLGCVKTALEIFERLHLWDDMIICNNLLQMRQRSAKIVKDLLEKEETPKLWCHMGDATDDIECYKKAWALSNEKSGRAQRCMGNYYYVRKNYQKAIDHFEISLKINTLQFTVWQRLAFSALQIQDWKTCARAYRRCSVLEPDCFESWNNMSQAYINLNEKDRAWRSLQEAIRCRSDSWKVWDNYMAVSTSLGYMQQAFHAYTQILRLKEKHVDTAVLGRIVYAIIEAKTDPNGGEMKMMHKKCAEFLAKLSREVPSNPELWFLYAEIVWATPSSSSETKHTAMQYYRKSIAAEIQKGGWDKDTEKCILVIMRCLRLVDVAVEALEVASSKAVISDLGSIRMLLKNCFTTIKRSQTSVGTGELVESLNIPLKDLEDQVLRIENLINTRQS